MRNIFAKADTSAIDAQIASVIASMTTFGPDSPEYPDLLTKLERLETLKASMKPKPLSRDTLVTGLVTLLGIGIVVGAEQKHVLSNKGLALLPRSLK